MTSIVIWGNSNLFMSLYICTHTQAWRYSHAILYRFFQLILYWSIASFRYTAKWCDYTYKCIYSFQILFPFNLLHNIEQSSLCYTVDPCWLSTLNIAVYIHGNPKLPNYPSPTLPFSLVSLSSFSKFVNLFVFKISAFVSFFLDSTYKWYCMIFLSVWLTSLNMTNSSSIHIAVSGIIFILL